MLDSLTNSDIIILGVLISVILNLNTRNDNVILGDEEKILFGREYIVDEFDGLKFKISLNNFIKLRRSKYPPLPF